jgi:hypothetical protein
VIIYIGINIIMKAVHFFKSINIVMIIGLAISVPKIAFSATEIGNSGVFFNNLPDGTVNFYSEAGEINFLGDADPDDITSGSVRPCDADGPATGLENTNALPVTLSTATYSGFGSSTFPPSSTSGHCFYRLSNGEFVAIKDMSDIGETSTIDAFRIFSCPGTLSVTSTGLNLAAANCIAAALAPAPQPVPTMSVMGLGLLVGLLGIIGFRRT